MRTLATARVLYSDLDGTLLGRGGSLLADGDGLPTLVAAEALVAIKHSGLECVACTGRNRAQSSEISRILGWRGFIAELGCVLVPDRGAAPHYLCGDWSHAALEPAETPYDAITRSGALDALREAFPGRIEYHDPYHLAREATHVLRGDIDVDAAREILSRIQPAVDIIDNGIIQPLSTTLRDVSTVHAYHLVPAGASKARAIAFDLARRGLSRERAIAIGDSEMDVAMADAVGLCVLVGNALDDERVMAAAALRDNVVVVNGRRGAGWAELAHAWITTCAL